MSLSRLGTAQQRRLQGLPVTAPVLAATPAPAGYHPIRYERTLTRRDLDDTLDDLLGWRLHEGAGLAVLAASDQAVRGEPVLLRLGVGRAALRIPCRVIDVERSADGGGFTYATLRGHPERGVERFRVTREADGSLLLRIDGYWAPATILARAGAPVSRPVQRRVTQRYLDALDRL